MNARTRLILAVVGVVLVIALGFLFLIRPAQSELTEVQAQVVQEEALTEQLELELEQLRELQRNAPALRAELERIRALVPLDHEVPNFLFQVTAAANASGVEFLQITPELPKSPPEGAALAEVRITMGGEGGYFAIQDFVRRLYSLDRALRIDLIALSTEENRPGVKLTATARIFFEPPTGLAGAPTTPTTPVAPPPTEAPLPGQSPAATSPSPATSP